MHTVRHLSTLAGYVSGLHAALVAAVHLHSSLSLSHAPHRTAPHVIRPNNEQTPAGALWLDGDRLFFDAESLADEFREAGFAVMSDDHHDDAAAGSAGGGLLRRRRHLLQADGGQLTGVFSSSITTQPADTTTDTTTSRVSKGSLQSALTFTTDPATGKKQVFVDGQLSSNDVNATAGSGGAAVTPARDSAGGQAPRGTAANATLSGKFLAFFSRNSSSEDVQSAAGVLRAEQRVTVNHLYANPAFRGFSFTLPDAASESAVMARLRRFAGLQSVEPDRPVGIMSTAADIIGAGGCYQDGAMALSSSCETIPRGIKRSRAAWQEGGVWKSHGPAQGVGIAIMDTGGVWNHPDLHYGSGGILGVSCTGEGGWDYHGKKTHVGPADRLRFDLTIRCPALLLPVYATETVLPRMIRDPSQVTARTARAQPLQRTKAHTLWAPPLAPPSTSCKS